MKESGGYNCSCGGEGKEGRRGGRIKEKEREEEKGEMLKESGGYNCSCGGEGKEGRRRGRRREKKERKRREKC
ncbi:hypothetical protein BHE74_00057663 [Ensete ventricosum]|nr:hypothetical protein BHE74_00057663 [Ensete ventricosum]